MSINAHLMNVIPYNWGEANPSGGFDFRGVSGIRIASIGEKISLPVAIQIAILDPTGISDLWRKIEIEYRGNIVAQSVELVDGGRYPYRSLDVWGWTQLVEFEIYGMGLYKVNFYLQEGANGQFDECHGTFSIVLIDDDEKLVDSE